jgi:hypothetical protein
MRAVSGPEPLAGHSFLHEMMILFNDVPAQTLASSDPGLTRFAS